jgi:hypothetical protein
MKSFLPLLLLASFSSLLWFGQACTPSPDKIVLRQDGIWEVRQALYESYLDEDFISSRDETNEGILSFIGAGTGTWIFPDSILIDFQWAFDSEEELMNLQFSEIIFSGEEAFAFKVFENNRNKQLWQAEKNQMVWNVLTQDSSEQRIVARWQLVRREE